MHACSKRPGSCRSKPNNGSRVAAKSNGCFSTSSMGQNRGGANALSSTKPNTPHRGPTNPRFVVTNLQGDPQELYDKVYCGRGEMENRIKEQMQLFSERTSAHKWWANQWRLLLSGLAYTLMEALRRFALKGTKWARLQCHSLRLKLIKIGAVIVRNTRTIHFHLSESYPWASLFNHAARRLVPT